ncbi:hypothetical protein A3K29_04130 [Candidatus Collierbacteria bacterium RIFOXYB2_FULL_46_14]|uniref:Uncharacterized protein n=1 Tax=Candidatus Collierbacteria bacterium GW2011_GWA2_46_26 TaxID=1618381 RepID=A0A0G1PKZ8_9BACT|nr:MAG: hypothetical protein UW29_C0002G0012 [Candidatus Collierbacteria bacterium GW2011_GWC2_44_13]KKU33489.1 MAG: hypothetical protein UX47_C0003G0012 [Candidatus Collierbacteria bacterium GW2011_GWA2_46_26]OGD73292.1 MAG: hypothetical protein A3K29_04130 [Candidatus Collierbacteria bacterium RIFOXYB2_FULL_46_14]OGD76334.1 MAG: hypothetical protein A3K43_04130 [Candidatus Collierbacteria bacterium RIFOXYA2_FULL_46_20]OGD77670.1 MAG: hypothetical protein A3K39_04130 [Candidatus Collierbacteri
MTIKEQENQLVLKINLEVAVTIVLWTMFWGFLLIQVWQARLSRESSITISENVPTIKQENLGVLRASVRSIISSNLPVVRMEPFD